MLWLEDLKSALGVWIVFAIFFCLIPKLIFPEAGARNALLRFFGRLVRIMLASTSVVTILSFFHILNALTLAGFFLSLVLVWARLVGSKRRLRERFLRTVAWCEEWYKRRGWRSAFRFQKTLTISPAAAGMVPAFVAGMIVLSLVAEVRLWWPLRNLRFAYPDAYVQLLNVRELLHDSGTLVKPSVLISVLGVVASLGAMDPMQVIRFLSPVLDILVSVGAGMAMATIFRNSWVGVFTTFVVGCYSERSVVGDGTLGVFFLLLGVAFLVDCFLNSQRASLYDALCALVLFALSLPRTVPREIALPLLLICVLGIVTHLLHRWTPDRQFSAFLPAVLMIGGFVVARPTYPRPHFVEYESSARQSLRIAATHSNLGWTVVAPTEQFSETFGTGQYVDLAQFVNKYRDHVSDPGFRFPYQTLFIFVEKHPFQYFESEPTVVSFSVLTDPTYRNYRSPAGRSSLELTTANFCAKYASLHSSEVFYEDDDLRIYEFTRDLSNVKKASGR